MLVYNVGEITSYVKQMLKHYDKRKEITQSVVVPHGFGFSEYVTWQWYIYALDYVHAIKVRAARGWCAPDQAIERFALRKTQLELDHLYRAVRIPERCWTSGVVPVLRLENFERDLILNYKKSAERNVP